MVDATSTDDIAQNVNAGNTDTDATKDAQSNSSGCIYDKWGRTFFVNFSVQLDKNMTIRVRPLSSRMISKTCIPMTQGVI